MELIATTFIAVAVTFFGHLALVVTRQFKRSKPQ
jgi:hypothetical protein